MSPFLFGPGLPLLLLVMAILVVHVRLVGWHLRCQGQAADRPHDPVLYFLLMAPWCLLTGPPLAWMTGLIVLFVLSHLLLVSGGRDIYRSGLGSRLLYGCREACLILMAVNLCWWSWEMLR